MVVDHVPDLHVRVAVASSDAVEELDLLGLDLGDGEIVFDLVERWIDVSERILSESCMLRLPHVLLWLQARVVSAHTVFGGHEHHKQENEPENSTAHPSGWASVVC